MKKLLVTSILAISSSLFTFCEAQYTVLHSFSGNDGAYPSGALSLSGKVLYGMADEGGANGFGCVFSIDTMGNNYKDIFDFDSLNGAYPEGGYLKLSGSKLFGMTQWGGANDSGCVFTIDTNGGNYKDILDFAGLNGAEPWGSMTLSGSKMFGMTNTGGVNIMGNIFTIDTTGANYKDLMDFNGTDGANPYGDVTIIGSKLYSMTGGGGANGYGNIFSIDSNGNNFTDILDFNGTNGAYANNILALSGTEFFGTTYGGGAPGLGNVFDIDTSGMDFKDLVDFNGTSSPEGEDPYGDVILSGNVLYGMTSAGGANDSGCIYSIDTNGNNYTDLFDFTGPNGETPYSNVTISGNTLYGTAAFGGGNNYAGVIFSFKTTSTGINKLAKTTGINLYPNPSNGLFTLQLSVVSSQSSVEVYNEIGEMIYSQSNIHNSTFNIDLSNNPNGVYFYRVISDNGSLIGNGKMVVQK